MGKGELMFVSQVLTYSDFSYYVHLWSEGLRDTATYPSEFLHE